jgi:hypothetical protein
MNLQPGYVYVLSNPSMPGLVKIGRSIHGGRKRAKELDQTGIPTPFKLEFEIFDHYHHQLLESYVHQRFSNERVNNLREFFRIPITTAVIGVVDEYSCLLLDHNLVCSDDAEGLAFVHQSAGQMGIDGHDLVRALNCISPFAAKQAMAEWAERREDRISARRNNG